LLDVKYVEAIVERPIPPPENHPLMDTQDLEGRIGPYRLLKRIARGGMGEIFLAKQDLARGYERTLVVKRILPHLSDDEKFVNMFLREAHTASKFQHRNIVQIYQVGQERSQYYLAMEHVDGKDLRAFLLRAAEGDLDLPAEVSCFILSEVCKALEYAHTKAGPGGECLHLVHCDVSPSNILLSYEGSVRLIDFGISKAADGCSVSHPGALRGKIPYLSPEQARGEPLDHRTDIFSAGVVFSEMLCGRPLFAGRSDYEILEKIRKFSVKCAQEQWQNRLPPILCHILERSLSENADNRYAVVKEMAGDIDQFLSGCGCNHGASSLCQWMNRLFAKEMAAEGEEAARTCTAVLSRPAASAPAEEKKKEDDANPRRIVPAPKDKRILKHKLVILILLLIIVLEAILFIVREHQWKTEGRNQNGNFKRTVQPAPSFSDGRGGGP
jgi:eukaryotic-like serine/threonine-protein kinase